MAENIKVHSPRKGMNTDVHPSNLQEGEYTFAYNSLFSSEEGDLMNHQNYPTTVKCGEIESDGFRIVGHKSDYRSGKVFFFLNNPDTGVSKIVYINYGNVSDVLEGDSGITEIPCRDCGSKEIAISDISDGVVDSADFQCNVVEVLNDSCNIAEGELGFGFDINDPIRDLNVHIKIEAIGETLTFINKGIPFLIRLYDLDSHKKKLTVECGDDIIEECLDFNTIKLFRKFDPFCLEPKEVAYGGSLKEGVYEFLAAYSDIQGNELSEYFTITPQINIFDDYNISRDRTENALRTNYGIRLKVKDLDSINFEYYKVVVIQRASIDNSVEYIVEGVHHISQTSINYQSDLNKDRTTISNIFSRNAYYENVKHLAVANGYLFLAGLTAEKEYNLQPVINLLGAFLRWQTVETTEDYYSTGLSGGAKGYYRDEVQPFAIRFLTERGGKTIGFVLPGRPANDFDREPITAGNNDYDSIEEFSPNCSTNERNERWQYYNTASVVDSCNDGGSEDILCDPRVFQTGKFGYWESTETYPDNKFLFDSSTLNISQGDIPTNYVNEFEEYFVESGVTDYVLNENTELLCNPVRHPKMPDNCLAPFMSSETVEFAKNKIYPLGVYLDDELITAFLDLALKNELITQEQRDAIVGYEIFAGDRSLNKSIISKGMAFDMFKYNEFGKEIWYPNYPYNDLSEDVLHYTDNQRDELIQHPYGGVRNTNYTYHSPETHYLQTPLGSEVHLEGYQGGHSRGVFSQVDGHAEWVILSSKAYTAASFLAAGETLAEAAALYGDFQVQNAIAGDRVVRAAYIGRVGERTQLTTSITGTTSTIGTEPGTTTYALGGSINGDPLTNYDDYGNGYTDDPLNNSEDDIKDGHDGLQKHSADVNKDKLTGLEKAAFAAVLLQNLSSKFGQYRYEWLNNIKNSGNPENFAYFYTSVGHYNKFECNNVEGNKLRAHTSAEYLKSGRYSVNDRALGEDIKINNVDREFSVFLGLGSYFFDYNMTCTDNSRFVSTEVLGDGQTFIPDDEAGITDGEDEGDTGGGDTGGGDTGGGGNPGAAVDTDGRPTYDSKSPEIQADIQGHYISLRNYVPDQWGDIYSINWLPTGYCGRFDGKCDTIFGGTVYISRFSLKRKLPLFLVNSLNQANLTPFNYYPYRNIGHTKFYVDYDVTENRLFNTTDVITDLFDGTFGTILEIILAPITTLTAGTLPESRSYFVLDDDTRRGFYVRNPSKFYLFYYGIPNFLVESEINNSYRLAGREPQEDFFPHVGDYENWTQETNVSIREPNQFRYNFAFSTNQTVSDNALLPITYDPELYERLYDIPNGVIWSDQDSSEVNLFDPWYNFRPLNSYRFPTRYGDLINITSIESQQVMAIFENQTVIFNAVDTLRDRLDGDNQLLGSGGIFATRPLEFPVTDLGYAGTQHKVILSNEFGHFSVDAKRGKIFQVNPQGRDLDEISRYGKFYWFKNHLPFKLLDGGIQGLTDKDIDNVYRGIGISMGWDSRNKLVYITKLDKKVRPAFKNLLTFEDGILRLGLDEVTFEDENIFEDASFTISFSPEYKSWTSFWAFQPLIYIPHINYFQTVAEGSVWSHLITNKSFQYIYGNLEPWIVESPILLDISQKSLKSLHYWMDTRRYHNEFDYAEIRNKGFNKLEVYNNSDHSGLLHLIPFSEISNRRELIRYPINVADGTQITAVENDKVWKINQFFNRIQFEYSNIPHYNKDNVDILKDINLDAFNFNQRRLDRMRGDWYLSRWTQDEESAFKMILKLFINNENQNRV